MDEIERLAAAEAIRLAKARYFRGVDTGDGDLVRSVLARDCVLDYRGCCTDPATGRDFVPAMNVVLEGRDAWRSDALAATGIVSVHQGHQGEIEIAGDGIAGEGASAVWAMTDRLFMPAGSPFRVMTGYGFYRETYVREDGEWRIATLRIERLRVEAE